MPELFVTPCKRLQLLPKKRRRSMRRREFYDWPCTTRAPLRFGKLVRFQRLARLRWRVSLNKPTRKAPILELLAHVANSPVPGLFSHPSFVQTYCSGGRYKTDPLIYVVPSRPC